MPILPTLPTLPFAKLLLASAVAMTVSACGGGSDHDDVVVAPPPPVVVAGDVFVLTASNKLLSFDRATPATIRTTATVTGLQAGENLLGIDFRPADGQLYGVGSTGRIYTLNGATGAATLKSSLAADAADTTAPYTALAGTQFGVDFNPLADRLRIVSDTGQSLRINVDTGATTTDGNINGGASNTAITAAETLRIAHNRYRNGYASYLEELDAQRTLYSADVGRLQLRTRILVASVDLYRAMGGGWAPQSP